MGTAAVHTPKWCILLYLLDVHYQTSIKVDKQANLQKIRFQSTSLSDSLLWTQQTTVLSPRSQPSCHQHQIPLHCQYPFLELSHL
jgi:hypothetical protein